MKNFKRVLSLALAALMVIGGLVIAPVDAKAEGTYTKVTSVDEIKAGGNFVIIAKKGDDQYFAMGTDSGNFRNAVEVTIGSTGEIAAVDTTKSVPVWAIAKIGTTENISISFGSSYASWNTGDGNNCKLATDSTLASVGFNVAENEGADADTFLFTSVVDPARTLSYNATNPRFACYGNKNQNYKLLVYKYSGVVDTPEDIDLSTFTTPAEIVNAAYAAKENNDNLVGSCTLTGVIKVISDAYTGGTDYKNVTVTMQIGDMADKLIVGYRIAVADTTDEAELAKLQNLSVGDTITVQGAMEYTSDVVRFKQGGIITNIEKGELPPTLPADATPEQIVNAAYNAMETNTPMIGTYTLEGVITSVDTAYSSQYQNITVTMQVGDMTTKLIQCYRLTGTDADKLKVGDKIKVEGTLSYYNGKVQFAAGSVLKAYEVGKIPNTLPDTATPEEIVNAAYAAMENGTPMIGEYKLTGVIKSIDTEYSEQYKNITVTIVVDGMENKTIQCYRLAGTGVETLKVGDTITVNGSFGSYNGTVQYNAGSTLVSVVAAGDIASNAVVVIFAGLALVAVALVSKRKMA